MMYFYLFLIDLLGYIYLMLKIYRVICFSKITFDQLPLLNPYTWPFSLIRVITRPYFRFWSKLLPNLKIGKFSYDVSGILGLEILSCILAAILQLRTYGLSQIQIAIENM